MAALTLTPYKRRYSRAVQDLLFRSHRSHTHLDWQETQHWLEAQHTPLMRLAWQNWRLVGLLAASYPLNHCVWMRLAAVDDRLSDREVMRVMWDDLVPELRGLTVNKMGVLAAEGWIESLLPFLGFAYIEDVVTRARGGPEIPPPRPNHLEIHTVEPDDLAGVLRVDHAAFAPPWQLTTEDMRQAHRLASSCTLAQLDGVTVGYQLSTLYLD
ncbi:MAG: hypothetical protein K8I60_14815, partial [Anaerolineae bacterium]|nr:hypothetical protein [Anaerolineae bacterium]